MIKEREFNESIFPKNFWFSPSWVIDTFNYYLEESVRKTGDRMEGFNDFIRNRKTKKLKEMWVTAVFLLGYEVMTKNPHWLQPCGDTAPDTVGVCFLKSKRIIDSDDQAQIFIEITEWEKNTKDTLLALIKAKISKKSYPDYYHLVVHITRLGNLNMNLDELSNELLKIPISIAGIWIVVNSVKLGEPDNYLVACLFPFKIHHEFSLSKAVNRDRENKIPPLMTIIKKKGRGFRKFGPIRINLPPLN